jgi:hypothetical protein
MTVLAAGALAGVRVRVAGAAIPLVAQVGAAVRACGAELRGEGPADQVVVGLELAGDDASVASGAVADELTAAFVAARDALGGLPAGGGVLLVVAVGAAAGPVRGAVAALCRSLALESAGRGVRVNALLVGPAGETGDLAAFLLGPAATMLTGAVLEAG